MTNINLIELDSIEIVLDERGHKVEASESRSERKRILFVSQILGDLQEACLGENFGSTQVERVVEELSSMDRVDLVQVGIELSDQSLPVRLVVVDTVPTRVSNVANVP